MAGSRIVAGHMLPSSICCAAPGKSTITGLDDGDVLGDVCRESLVHQLFEERDDGEMGVDTAPSEIAWKRCY